MSVATQKELQELNISLLLNPSSWIEGMNDEADFDVLNLNELAIAIEMKSINRLERLKTHIYLHLSGIRKVCLLQITSSLKRLVILSTVCSLSTLERRDRLLLLNSARQTDNHLLSVRQVISNLFSNFNICFYSMKPFSHGAFHFRLTFLKNISGQGTGPQSGRGNTVVRIPFFT